MLTKRFKSDMYYEVTRYVFKYGNEADTLENTVTVWDSLEKAKAYINRYATGLKWAGAKIEVNNIDRKITCEDYKKGNYSVVSFQKIYDVTLDGIEDEIPGKVIYMNDSEKPVAADEQLPTDIIQEKEPPKSAVQKTEPLKKITSTNLILIDKSDFGNIKCSVYSDKQGNILMTREQIGRALGYKNPNDAIRFIHERNKERLNKFSVSFKLNATDGKKYDTVLYTRKGVYEICRFSHQPKANAFYDWVYDLLEALATGQAKITAQKQTEYWQYLRARSKEEYRALTDTIKIFVDYAKAQGSKRADFYYIAFSRLTNSMTATIDRDNTDVKHLHSIIMTMAAIRKAITDGIAKCKPYKQIYSTCKDRLKALKDWGALALAG